jgi:O-6-methylguanine DNA methyltransferase
MSQLAVDSPLGPILVVATPRGISEIRFFADRSFGARPSADVDHPDAAVLAEEAARQIEAYFAEGRPLDLPLDLQGTEFQRRVWQAIAAIPFGQTASYRDMAIAAGAPNAYRAAGSACGANPAVLIVPCHRVIGSDRGLHGFGAGLDRKVWLLDHEAAYAGAEAPRRRQTSLQPLGV